MNRARVETECVFDRLAAADVSAAYGAYRPTMRELPDELLAGSTIVIDELGAVLEESDEIIHALEAGAITRDHLTELGTALASDSTEYGKRTVFKTVGIAMQDWAGS
jgi:ornithine cyclodeaminase